MRRRLIALGLALAPLLSPAFAGEGGGKALPPVTPIIGPPTPLADKMLDAQRLQARMAEGDRTAYAELRARMRAIGAEIAAAEPAAFKVKAEREAVIVYLLSGGQPRDVAKIADRGDFPAAEADLLAGAAGYAAGREADAERLLAFDAGAQSLRVASQLAYAQSVLLTAKDSRKALDLLDLARLLAPGTLIEEAALRREILLVGDHHDADRVAFLARQYVERFGASVYASEFVRALAAAAVRYDLCASLPDLGKFSALLQIATPEQTRAFLLTIGRASVLLGRFDLAAKVADDALRISAANTPDEARARLYVLLSRFPRMSDEAAKTAFAKIALDRLPPADRELLAAASFVDQRLTEPPPPEAYEEIWREISVAASRSPDLAEGQSDPPTATLRRAEAALAAAEALGAKGSAP